MTPRELLIRARKRIERPECWTQRADARRADREHTYPSDDDAVCWCGNGALIAEEPQFTKARSEAYRLLKTAVGEAWVSDWNDTVGRTHAEVLAAFDRAIELAAPTPEGAT